MLLVVGACTARKEQPAAVAADTLITLPDTVAVTRTADITKDKTLDALALYVAGLPQQDSNSFSILEEERVWKDFQASTDSNWTRIYDLRLSKMQAWQRD